MSCFFVREVSEADIPKIVEIEKSSFSDPWSEGFLFSQASSDNYFVVACDDNEVVGYAILGISLCEAELYNIAVSPEHRGKGLGDMLIENLCSFAGRNGLRQIFLEVRESNLPAISLYKKHGYVLNGRRRNYYRNPSEDAVLMVLSTEMKG